MPNNPSTSRVTTAKGAGMPNQQGLNNPTSYNGQGYNTFPKDNYQLRSPRFAGIYPFFAQESIEGDVMRFKTNFKLSSYTMKNPFVTELSMHQDFFSVPWSAMLDYWDLIYKVPLNGSDIPDDSTPFINPYTIMRHFTIITGHLQEMIADNDGTKLVHIIRAITLFTAIFSDNGLLKNLGWSWPHRYFSENTLSFTEVDFDKPFEELVKWLTGNVRFQVYQNSYEQVGSPGTIPTYYIEPKTNAETFNFLEDLMAGRFNLSTVSIINGSTTIPGYEDLVSALHDINLFFPNIMTNWYNASIATLDVKRLIAYQMCVAQFYNNPNVDVVKSSAAWKSNMKSLMYSSGVARSYFTHLGVSYEYDVFSNKKLTDVFAALYDTATENCDEYAWSFLMNLFGIQHSLRAGDYFYSSRLQPLAVDTEGDTSIAVNNNVVAALDVNKGLRVQRYINAVNRSSGEIYEYMANMAGVKPQRIAPQPNFIIHQSFDVQGQEVENTAGTNDEAGKTMILQTSRSNYLFEIFNDEPSVILGLVSFQMPYIYPDAIDRNFFQHDRYDWFQALLQDVGDQEVLKVERDANNNPSELYGYQLRYAQFKYGISQAAGAFAHGDLPSYAMLAPNAGGDSPAVISSGELRNNNSEFDQFFASLTGVGLSDRFHFILCFRNEVTVNSRQETYPKL